MDNFDDFTPSSKCSSKLASIFGQDKGQHSNASLTYTAPKQPKNESSPKQIVLSESSAKLELIIAKTVFAYKLVNSAYQSLGKMGVTIVGCPSPPIYQLLMYKTKEDVQCRLKINSGTVFSILADNYASFYVDSQNYSVKFENDVDVKEFAKKFAQAKSFSAPSQNIISQVVKFGIGKVVARGSTVSVKATCYQISDSCPEVLIGSDIVEVIIGDDSSYCWISALEDMKYDEERVLTIPKNISEPWNDNLADGTILLLHVELTELVLCSTEEKYDVKTDSSAEDSSSFKEKSALLESALASKSLKSGLLSRVARLGQPMLPLKGAIVADLTDSEDDLSTSPKPRIRSKTSLITSRTSQPTKPQEIQNDSVQLSKQPAPQPLALYQPQYQSQIIMRNDATTFGQIQTPTGSCLISPSDPSLPVYFAESRTQATELRMGISKLNDKVDMVLNKIQSNSNLPVQQTVPSPILDPTGLLSSIQNLVQDNHQLKSQVEDQKTKIDTLNDRLYNLLELSHRSLEKNSATIKNQEIDDKELVILKKELQLAQNTIIQLNAQLTTSQENERDYKDKLTNTESQLVDLNMLREKSQQLEKQLIESDKKINEQEDVLSVKIKKITEENSLLKNHSEQLKTELELLKNKEQESKNENSDVAIIKQELIESKNLIEKMKSSSDDIIKLKSELLDCQARLEDSGQIQNELDEARSKIKDLLKSTELKNKEHEKENANLLSQIQQITDENSRVQVDYDKVLKLNEEREAGLSNVIETDDEKNKLLTKIQMLTDENIKIKSDYDKVLNLNDEREVGLNNGEETDEKKNNLLTKVQQLTEENVKIKAELSKTIIAKADVSSTKILMNNLYRNIHTQFEVNGEYSGETIKQILASSIRDMTLQFLEQHESNSFTVDPPSVEDSETVNTDGSSVNEFESKGTIYKVENISRSLPTSPDTKSEKSISSSSAESPEKSISAGAKNIEDCLDIQFTTEKQTSYNQIWQPSQPPPLPAFDEDEDDAW